MISSVLLKEKNKIFKQALSTFKKALDAEENEFVRDASIQRFEYCYELGWKLLKKVVEYEDKQMSGGPTTFIKRALELGILDREDLWMEISRARNLTTLTYNEELAQDLYLSLQSHYETMINFADFIDTKYN